MLGRAVATHALAEGHDVTCLARGVAGEAPDGVRWVRGDRDSPTACRGDGRRRPLGRGGRRLPPARQVRRAVAALEPVTDRFVFVSTGNVYADHSRPASDESVPLLPPLDGDVMADMRSTARPRWPARRRCSRASATRALIARAGLIGGPGDWSGRSGWWPWRFAHPVGADGAVLTPDDPDLPMAVIDVRDLAAWLVRCAASADLRGVRRRGRAGHVGRAAVRGA